MTEYNKVVYDGQTLIDLTQDDVTASDVRSGVYFHSADGVRGQGTLVSTSTPTANTIAEWDNDAHMNSTDMTSQEVDDFVDSLNVTGINAVDYVVEQGTSGIWTYVKWNSGRLECHGNYVANIAINTSSGAYAGYRSAAITVSNFPVAFVSTPTVVATAQGAGGWWVNNVADSNTTRPAFYLSCGASLSSSSRSIAISAYGKWK